VSSTLCDSTWISWTVSNRRPFSFNFIFGIRKTSQGVKWRDYGGWGWESFCISPNTAGWNGNVRRGVVMVKETGIFSPNFGSTSSHVFTHSPQNFTVELEIHSLICWARCFALPHLLYRWRNQSGIYWIPTRVYIYIYQYFDVCFHTAVTYIGYICFSRMIFQGP
jgi:hypothetical protein